MYVQNIILYIHSTLKDYVLHLNAKSLEHETEIPERELLLKHGTVFQ